MGENAGPPGNLPTRGALLVERDSLGGKKSGYRGPKSDYKKPNSGHKTGISWALRAELILVL